MRLLVDNVFLECRSQNENSGRRKNMGKKMKRIESKEWENTSRKKKKEEEGDCYQCYQPKRPYLSIKDERESGLN